MLSLIGKLAPLITGMTKNEDGTDKRVTGEFQWLVRLPVILGGWMVVGALFGPSIPPDRQNQILEAGLALLVGGPVVYHGKRQMTKGDAVAQQAPAVAAAPPPPAPAPVEPPKTDVDVANAIEKL